MITEDPLEDDYTGDILFWQLVDENQQGQRLEGVLQVVYDISRATTRGQLKNNNCNRGSSTGIL